MIASHYAEPVERTVRAPAVLRDQPSPEGEPVGELVAGDPFLMLDDSLGWVWGYGGADRRVGYMPSAALAPQ